VADGRPIPADSDSLIIAMNDGKPMAPKLMCEFPHAALSLLGKLRNRIANADEFGRFAMQHSHCPTALEGGQLGTLPRGKLYVELDAAAFELAASALSAPVETTLGLHLLRCDRIHPAVTPSFPEARERILDILSAATRLWFKRVDQESMSTTHDRSRKPAGANPGVRYPRDSACRARLSWPMNLPLLGEHRAGIICGRISNRYSSVRSNRANCFILACGQMFQVLKPSIGVAF